LLLLWLRGEAEWGNKYELFNTRIERKICDKG